MPQSSTVPDLDPLQAGLLLLMDQYAETPCKAVAMAVAWRIERILSHPPIDLYPEVRRQCARGLNRWRARTVCAPDDHEANRQTLH